jgi:hypothetical protein
MRTKLVICAIASSFTTGCTTTAHEEPDINRIFVNQKNHTAMVDRVIQDTINASNQAFRSPNLSTLLSEMKLDIGLSTQKVANGTKVEILSSSPEAFYSPGEYDLVRRSDRVGLTFIKVSSKLIMTLKDTLDDNFRGINYELEVTFYGSTDARKIRKKIAYLDDYGRVNISSDDANLNGSPEDFSISAGQTITTNSSLGFLRAYGTNHWFTKAFNQPFTAKYEITTRDNSNEYGEQYRYAKFTVLIKY